MVASTSSAQWKAVVVATAIPLGDGNVSTTPKTGYVDSCTTDFRGGGAQHSGSWIDTANKTWNARTKVAVQGSVNWTQARASFSRSGDQRRVTTNDLPKGAATGTFPIAPSDPAYQYDRNPNSIGAQSVSFTVPVVPSETGAPSCLPLGPIGVLLNGVLVFDALDAAGRDAGAHEVQDSCGGHPQMAGAYHYHAGSPCVLAGAKGRSTLVGYALDGFGIYVERDASGNLPTDADLDECHGRTSAVTWDGARRVIYHYDVTLEYPYTLGCFRASPVRVPLGG